MSSRRHTRQYRSVDKDGVHKIFFIGYQLDELFDEEQLNDFLVVARRRIVGEFFYATDRYRGRRVSTDNYIVGVGDKLSDLACYVTTNMKHRIVRCAQLPSNLQNIPPKMLDRLIARAEYDLLLTALQVMRHREVWYDEARGIWQVTQSAMDDYLQIRYTPATPKRDDRSYHGRVRSQSKARGIPEGTSIGVA